VAGGSPNPNIIGARLRAAAMTPPSAHPDADLLTAFAEHCLNESEHARILEHLAQCTVCRDVVYFAQPEEEATLKPAQSPAQTHWFAGRRLQWAALAASLSMIAAIAIYVRTNPERMAQYEPATASPVANKEAAPQGNTQNDAGAAYSTSPATSPAEKPDATRRESNLKAPEAQQKAIPGGTVAGSLGRLSKDDADEARAKTFYKTNGTFDDKEAAKQTNAFNFERKDAETGKNAGTAGDVNGLLTTNGGTASEKDRLFDLRQQKTQGGPYANTSNANSNQIQNQANLDLYRHADGYTGNMPAGPPPPALAAASPGAKAVEMSQSSTTPASSTSASTTLGTRSAAAQTPAPAKRAAVTRGVVPAEEARKKKLETIPAQSTAQATEETVAVAGQAPPEVATRTASAPASVSQNSVQNMVVNNRDYVSNLELTPGVARTTAITGWRLHHGRVQERLYGIWHDAVMAAQPAFSARNTVTDTVAVARPRRFAGVSAVGADVWAVQAIGRGQSSLVVYHSRDAGVSWQPSILAAPGALNPGAQVTLKFTDSQQGEVTLSTGEKWQTSDGGAQWKFVK